MRSDDGSGCCRVPSSSPGLAPPSLSSVIASGPLLSSSQHVALYLQQLHGFLTAFTYKTTAGPEHTPDIQLIKSQPFRALCATAQRIIQARQPIKCLEAVVIALCLTSSLPSSPSSSLYSRYAVASSPRWYVTRLPVRFYTACAGHRYWHVVLVLAFTTVIPQSPSASSRSPGAAAATASCSSYYGAVSLSRHPPLSSRPLSHPTLSSLCSAFKAEYRRIGHRLLRITVGLPMPEGERSRETPRWHFLLLNLTAAQHHDSTQQPMASEQRHEEKQQLLQEREDGDERELQLSATQAAAVEEGELAAAEWRTARVVLDRYASSASTLLAVVRHNASHPSLARPLPPLHTRVHYQSSTDQLVYDGAAPPRGTAASTKSTRPLHVEEHKCAEEKHDSGAKRGICAPKAARDCSRPSSSRAARAAFAV